MRGLSLGDRLELLREAYSVHDGLVALELDGSWHPGAEPGVECVVLADLDLVDASEGLSDEEARSLAAFLRLSHVRGRLLPDEVVVDGVRFRVTPADEFTGHVTYLVHDGELTLLESTGPYEGRATLPALVALYRAYGRAAVVQTHGLASRLGLAAAITGVDRARTPSVA